MAIILGIDPGSRITGYGIIETAKPLGYLGSGCIRTIAEDMPGRLKQIYGSIQEIIRQFQPDYCAIEQVFMAHNVSSALKLGHARGVAMLASAEAGIPIFEYAARYVKQCVTGTGGAAKTQVQHMVKELLKLNGTPQVDAADALAIAITHAFNLLPHMTVFNRGYM